MTQALGLTQFIYTLPLVSGANVPWRYLAASDHAGVYLDADGEILGLAEHGADFRITPEGDTPANTGTIAITGQIPVGATSLQLDRITPATQLYVPTPGAEGVAVALDRLTLQLQELRYNLSTEGAAGTVTTAIAAAAAAAASALAAAAFDGPNVPDFATLAELTYVMPGITAGALVLEKSTGTWWTIIGAIDGLTAAHLDYRGAGGIALQLHRQSNLTPDALGYTGTSIGPDSTAVTLWASLMGSYPMARTPSPIGVYRHNTAIVISGAANPVANFAADFQLTADIGSGAGPGTWSVHFKVSNCDKWVNLGSLRVSGADHTGSGDDRAAYATRRADIGFRAVDCRHADFGRLITYGYRVCGLFGLDGKPVPTPPDPAIDSFTRCDFVEAISCGAWGASLTTTTTGALVNSGTNLGNSARTTVPLASIPAILFTGADLLVPCPLHPSGKALHKIMAIDRGAGTVTVYPAIPATTCPSGTAVEFWQGAGLHWEGNDHNKAHFTARVVDCAHAFIMAHAYNCRLDIYAQACGSAGKIGTVNPLNPDSVTAITRNLQGLYLHGFGAEFNSGDEWAGTPFGLIFDTVNATGIEISGFPLKRFEPFHLGRDWTTTKGDYSKPQSHAPGVTVLSTVNGFSTPQAQGQFYVDGLSMGSPTDNLIQNGPPLQSVRKAHARYAGFQLKFNPEAIKLGENTVIILRDSHDDPGGSPVWEDLVVALSPGDVTAYSATINYIGEAASTVVISSTTYQGIKIAKTNKLAGLIIEARWDQPCTAHNGKLTWVARPIGFIRAIPAAITDTSPTIAAGAAYTQADMLVVKAQLGKLATAMNSLTTALREKA